LEGFFLVGRCLHFALYTCLQQKLGQNLPYKCHLLVGFLCLAKKH
jgi:hypothetical protein